MSGVATCTQYDNYGPRKLHVTGIKHNPYDVTRNGIKYANGLTYNGTSENQSPQPAPGALATATPGCRSCHGGC